MSELDIKIKEYSQLRPIVSLSWLVIDWTVIFISIYLSIKLNNFLFYLFSILIIGSRQHAIGVLSHDIVHFRFMKNRKLADFIGNLFMTWPMFYTIPGFRSMHLRHHSKVNTLEDPDWVRRKGKSDWVFPMESKRLYKMLFMDITGLNLYQNIQKVFLPKSDKKLKSDFQKLSKFYYLGMALFYITLFTSFSYFNLWTEYFLYWIIPYFTWFKFIKRLRAIGEHFCISDQSVDELTRTTLIGPLESFFIAPHNINYHAEHHRWASIPWYNLKAFHSYLDKSDQFQKMGHLTSKGYLRGVLKEVPIGCELNKV